MNFDDVETRRAKIISETAKIPWRELERFFAAGVVIGVAPGLDLVAVACAMADDDKLQVENWLSRGEIALVSDDQARGWLEAETVVWAVVTSPWVLAQPVADVV
ncbi:MAG: DUF2288 domain-containing protein [Porticoccaceae bacterium]|jgi:hypothetical protein